MNLPELLVRALLVFVGAAAGSILAGDAGAMVGIVIAGFIPLDLSPDD
jgi:hypothetical protein